MDLIVYFRMEDGYKELQIHDFLVLYTVEPHGLIHEFILPKDAKGHDCMEKVCNQLNLIEKDFFGLRYKCPNSGVEMWLNLRNKMSDQLTGKPPYRMQLLVKFHVKPQELQQQITIDLFYLTIKKDLFDGKYNVNKLEDETSCRMLALLAYIECGDFDVDRSVNYEKFIPSLTKWCNEFYQMVEQEHFHLSKITPQIAKVELLSLVSDLDEYGVETFLVSSAQNEADKLILAVKHDGLRVFKYNTPKKRKTLFGKDKYHKSTAMMYTKEARPVEFIQYEDISTVSYKGKLFTIVDSDQCGTEHRLSFKLPSQQATINIFRTFTEFHSFYQCNVVKKSVQEKCTQTSVGRITSLLHPSTKSCKQYLFDVSHTRRQAYNYAWKELNDPLNRRQAVLFRSERKFKNKQFSNGKFSKDDCEISSKVYRTGENSKNIEKAQFIKTEPIIHYDDDDDRMEDNFKLRTKSVLSNGCDTKVEKLNADELKEVVRSLQDARICQVCMEETVSTAFCPCGHVVCCLECSIQCKECPLCRTHVTYAQRVFFACDA